MHPTLILACGAIILWLSFGARAGMGLYTTGSYSGAFLFYMALGVAAALVHLPVNEKPLAERRPVPAGA